MQQTRAMRAAYPQPSRCCSLITAFTVDTAQQIEYDLLPYFLSYWSSLSVTNPPAVTPKVPGPSPAGLVPHRRARSPLQSPPEPGCHSPRAKDGTRLDGPPRSAGSAELRFVASGVGEGGQHANHPEPRKSPCQPQRPSGKLAQTARGWHVPGRAVGRLRPLEGRGAGTRLQAECSRTPSPAPPRRRSPPPSAAGAGRERKRGARTPQRDPGLSARPRAPQLGPEKRGRCSAPRPEAGGRAWGQPGREGSAQPALLSWGRVICWKFTQAQP